MDLLEVALQVGVPAAVFLGLVAVWWLDRPAGGWTARLRSRFLLGVPWGTLVSALFVLAVYLLLQGGLTDWDRPLTLPFYSWSYFYPLGLVVAPFGHMSAGHLMGNLLGTLALAPVAEYAWSHFPVDRGETSFSDLRTNPYVRSFLLFPLGVLAVGLLTSVLHWGPVIGFSGVVYAFAGFAIVRYPVGTLLAVLVYRLAATAADAVQEPIVTAEASSSFNQPWFVDVAVQGHLVGFLLGAVLGAAVVGRRGAPERPSALRLWGATALFGSLLSPMWALWWIRGADTYVLHRAAGVMMIVVLGVLVAAGVSASDRELRWGVSRRTAGVLALVLPLLVMGVVAVPINATTVAEPVPDDSSVTVRDYTVTYAEGVTQPKTAIFDVSLFGERSTVVTGGVIVTSDDRELWTREISPARLEHYGRTSVLVGGIGWRERVSVRRAGWSALEGGTAYQVWLRPPDGEYRHVFASGNATAGVTIADRNVTIRPVDGEFTVVVTRDGATLARTDIPDRGEARTAGGLRFVRAGSDVYAVANGTRVPIASRGNGD